MKQRISDNDLQIMVSRVSGPHIMDAHISDAQLSLDEEGWLVDDLRDARTEIARLRAERALKIEALVTDGGRLHIKSENDEFMRLVLIGGAYEMNEIAYRINFFNRIPDGTPNSGTGEGGDKASPADLTAEIEASMQKLIDSDPTNRAKE